jgi:hypothetical protein
MAEAEEDDIGWQRQTLESVISYSSAIWNLDVVVKMVR